MSELRADNLSEWNPAWFDKADSTPDTDFYLPPRKLVHIDDGAIAAVTALYRELLPANGVILDLMSSWRSHLPVDVRYSQVVGLGMNAEEMADNPQLDQFVLHDLNRHPQLPFADQHFDAVICCVSVQYMQKPIEIFKEVGRVLKAGCPFILTFSNRCFPSKAINAWRYTDDAQHTQLVAIYFETAQGWAQITTRSCIPDADERGVDPLYAVWATKKESMRV
jgi:SAM-dependent methyltransferase